MGTAEHGPETTTDSEAASGLVVIGSSAGGIDALQTLIGTLPADFPVPIVIAQHLDPNRPSRLGDILANRSNLPVREASGYEALLPGTVYVVPADRDVEISDHHIGLRQDGVSRSHPSVDLLMGTAARVFGDTLTGVILSGAGSDGTAGAQAIKAYGGTVIVQDPRTARFAGMPASVPASVVDVMADLGRIGPVLVKLYQGSGVSLEVDDDGELRSFLQSIRDQTRLDFSAYKLPTIERRLQRRMVAVGTASLADYRTFIDRHPEEMQRLIASFLIKVTRFFRDPELFAHLRDNVLPGLIEEARQRGELRIWSAGCATGEEAYTLAMLVLDALGDDIDTFPIRIFATDVAPDAVEFARHGLYPQSAVADLPADLVERHFAQRDGAYEVRKRVRSLVVFGEHDLSRRAPFPRIDLVLCRNVLIYFAPELQRRSLQLFAFSLRLDGYLVLGKAETVNPLLEFFTADQSRLKLFRRVGGSAPIPPDRIFDSAPVRLPEPRKAWSTAVAPRPRPASTAMPPATNPHAVVVFDVMGVGVVAVDRNYHIRSINMAARRLLGIVSAGPGEDVIHRSTPDVGTTLRAALDTAFRGETVRTVHHVHRDAVEEDGRDLVLTTTPVPTMDADEPIDVVILEVVEVTGLAQQQRELSRERDELRAERDRLRDRMAIAAVEVRELRAADQAMAAEQGRLRAENEQLQVASEEAQAAAEEIETLNEEQQATNEELETLNEELQATVEELHTTNADLQARATELETMTAFLEVRSRESESERSRFEAILTSMNEAVQVVDDSGTISLSNPAWVRMFGADGEVVPEDDLGRPLPEELWPRRRALEHEPGTIQFTLPGASGDRRWFEASTQQISGGEDGQRGVIVIRDITDRSLWQLQQQFLAMASHELRTPLTTLSGSLQLLARRLTGEDVDGRLQHHVTRAREQVQRLEEHVSE